MAKIQSIFSRLLSRKEAAALSADQDGSMTVGPAPSNGPEAQSALQETRKALAETQGALFETQAALRHTQGALSETQAALLHTQGALSETQAALLHTQGALSETQTALTDTQAAFHETQTALFETQKVLWDTQVSSGLLDRHTGNSIVRDESLPSILLIAPPKTAGAYIMTTLLHGLKLERRWITLGYFGYDLFKYMDLERFWRDRGCVAFHHIDASSFNVALLKQTDLKILLNLRDPRQCLVSMLYYTLSHFPRPHTILPAGYPPDEYADWPFERQLDWQIEITLPIYVKWLNEWLGAVDRGEVGALITHYEDLISDEQGLFEKILEYYGIPQEKFAHPAVSLDRNVNFRKGDPDEWRGVFTANQKARALSLLPGDLMERFGWRE